MAPQKAFERAVADCPAGSGRQSFVAVGVIVDLRCVVRVESG